MTTRTAEREQFLADIITAAIEGGTGYWASVARYKWEDREPKHVCAAIIVTDDDEGRAKRRAAGAAKREATGEAKLTVDEALAIEGSDVHAITIETIAAGIGRITRGELTIREDLRRLIAEASRENDAGDIDADAADCIVQAALFGELVYG